MSNTAITAELVREALTHVMDPEIPVISVVDMGIIRDVAVGAEGVTVTMTPTFSHSFSVGTTIVSSSVITGSRAFAARSGEHTHRHRPRR